MNSLESPLDTLLFDYTSLAFFVNNIWTWVTVIAAALSFWRLRSTSSCPIKSHPPPPTQVHTTLTTTATIGASPSPTTSSSSTPSPAVDSAAMVGSSNEDEWLTKGKFAMAYHGDEEEVEEREIDGGVVEGEWEERRGGGGGGGRVVRRWGRDQEYEMVNKMIKVRMGDMGWRRHQDLKVLDGSVVRLWEEEKERNIRLHRRRYSSSSASLVGIYGCNEVARGGLVSYGDLIK